MMAQTLAEKILSKSTGRTVVGGEYILAPVAGAMASDTTAPAMIQAFEEMGGTELWDASKVSLVIDHAAPAPNERIAGLHQMMRDFAQKTGCHLYDVGAGICHHLMLDHGHVSSGDLFVGADSHTCTYGAIGSFATGVGSTDLAAVLKTGMIWLRVPESIKIVLNGRPEAGVAPKDVMLFVAGQLGPDLSTYRAIEFSGTYFKNSPLFQRIPFANMGAELGAKVSLVCDETRSELCGDLDATYVESLQFDVSDLQPQVSRPHSPCASEDLQRHQGTKIQQAFLGSCTNTRIEDLRAAAAILKGRKVADGVRMFVAPATRNTLLEAMKDGTLETLTEAGCTLLPSGCGPCVGTHLGVPGDGEVVISAANRNFRGRMGNPNADVYLASPEAVAASALAGEICSPREFLSISNEGSL